VAFTVSMNLNFSGFRSGRRSRESWFRYGRLRSRSRSRLPRTHSAALLGYVLIPRGSVDAGVADPGAGGELGPVSRDSKEGRALRPASEFPVGGHGPGRYDAGLLLHLLRLETELAAGDHLRVSDERVDDGNHDKGEEGRG